MKKFCRKICVGIVSAGLCLMLAACGGSGGQAQTDHDMPQDLNDTGMNIGTDQNLPVDYNQLEGSTEPSSDGAATEGSDPSGDDGEQPPAASDGQDENQDVESLPAEGPDDTEEADPSISDEKGSDDDIPTLSVPDGTDISTEIANLGRDIPDSLDVPTYATGTDMASNEYVFVDYSNTANGYVIAKWGDASEQSRIKCIVQGPSTAYNYNLTPGKEEVLPLSDGNGTYKVTVYRNTSGNKYVTILTADMEVKMSSEFAPFMNSNQYVDFAAAPNTVLKATSLCGGVDDPLEKVAKVYDFVVKNVSYDTDKAQNVQSGYLPVLDDILSSGKGICFDYAALMTGMLRSQDVPCKLVVGYAGGVYHAWISVWSGDKGWVEGFVYFDGITWQRMDPTFDSTSGGSDDMRDFIGDGSNYSAKYLY